MGATRDRQWFTTCHNAAVQEVATLRVHNVTLSAGDVRLRPMTEDDWEVVMTWNNDPDVLYYSEGDNVTGWRLEDLQRVFRTISRAAYIFLVEFHGRVVGECWLQEMNLDWLRARFEDEELWRIDLALAKESWGRGIGTGAVGLLCEFGFGPRVGAERIVAASVPDDNVASQRCFEKNGFQLFEKRLRQPGAKSREELYLMLTVVSTANGDLENAPTRRTPGLVSGVRGASSVFLIWPRRQSATINVVLHIL